jgi:tRNA threonylcarbamoyladenosine biosynthesis protein TsaB
MENAPRILLLDTSRKSCSVAISHGGHIIYKTAFAPGMKASERLHIMIAECLEATESKLSALSAVAVSIGPGSYTGLRIGLSAAKGLCLPLSIPLIAIPTLQQQAAAASKKHPGCTYISMIDARRDEVYVGVFDTALNEIGLSTPAIVNQAWVDKCASSFTSTVFCGDGAFKAEIFGENIICLDEVHAADMLPLAIKKWTSRSFESLYTCVPTYLKGPHITSSKKALFN